MLVQLTLLFLLILHSGLGRVITCKENETKGCLAGQKVRNMRQHPYHVSVQVNDQHRWSGAIISKDWVITTANHVIHYKDLYEYISIQAGSTNVTFLTEDPYAESMPVSKVIIHEKYDNVSFDYNIALLQMDEPLRFTRRIQPIPLANYEIINAYLQNIEYHPSYIIPVTMTGWGSFCIALNRYTLAQKLRKMELKLVSSEWCAATYFKGHCKATANMICAKFIKPGDCKDEPGSPLVFNDYLLGLLPLTCEKTLDTPYRVFMFIGNLRTWIFEKTGV